MHESPQDKRGSSPLGRPKSALAVHPSLLGSMPSGHRATSHDERQADWERVSNIINGHFGPVCTSEMAGVLQALHVLGLTPVRLMPSQEPPDKISTLEVGEAASPLTIRFEGQSEICDKLLQKITVPWMLRVAHMQALGFFPLYREALERIGFPRIKSKHPGFFAEIERAHLESAQRAQELPSCAPTPEEVLRRRWNTEVSTKLRRYINEFEKSHFARPGVPIRLEGTDGEPARILIGNQHETDPYIRELQRFPLRQLLFEEQRYMLAQFGEFLRLRFFGGDWQ